MDWNSRVKIDPQTNRRNLAPIVFVLIIVGLGLVCLGVYFGLFIGKLVY